MVLRPISACVRRIVPALAAGTAVLAGGSLMPAAAQEGHPLKGSWLGTWASNDVHGEYVLLVLDWDGNEVSGMINPGTDNIEIDRATLDPDGWIVRIEADGKDQSGETVNYRIEGRIENLELPDRSIVGTWKHERGSGAFEVSRQ